MLKLEEYIEKRKTEDGLSEFDSSQKMNHIKMSINYIFEYFDQYLPLQGIEKRTVYENEKLQKYEKSLREYSADVKEWFVNIYDTYETQANRIIANIFFNVDIVRSNGDFKVATSKYNFKKKTNVFDINTYYSRYSDKPFIKGKKKQLEILMMYIWLHSIVGDDEHYWDQYISQFDEY